MRKSRWSIILSQAIGQLALVVVLPMLTRIVPLTEMAAYQVALSLALVLVPLATMRIELFIPIAANSADAAHLTRISYAVLGGSSIFIAVVGLVGAAVSNWQLTSTCASLTLLLMAYGVLAVDSAHLIRLANRRSLVRRNLLSGSFAATLQLLSAAFVPTAWALALSVLVGRALAIAITRTRTIALDDQPAATSTMPAWTVRRGLTAVMSALAANTASQALTLCAVPYGPGAAAQTGVAQRAAAAPLALMSQGIAQAAQSDVADLLRSPREPIGRSIAQIVRAMLPLSLVFCIALIIGGPLLAEPIFGSGWASAGWIIAALAVPSGLQLLTAPLMSVFVMIGRESILLVLQCCRLLAALVAAALAHLVTGQFPLVVAAFALGNSIGYVAMLLALRRELTRFDDRRQADE